MAATSKTLIHRIAIKDVFDGLSAREKLYAHYLCKSAWAGGRIVMRQTSPEANGIFDFIMSLHRACGGHWEAFLKNSDVSAKELDALLDYCGAFLQNLGNYFGEGDQKFVPDVSAEALRKIATVSAESRDILEVILEDMIGNPKAKLGFTDGLNQSNYYPGGGRLSQDDIKSVSTILAKCGIEPENTRIRRTIVDSKPVFEVQQASAQAMQTTRHLQQGTNSDYDVRLVGGDHSREMSRIWGALAHAKTYASNEVEVNMIHNLMESFRGGDLNLYREAQKLWVTDISPPVDPILGFVEPYRDPAGVRGEWEGVVCISDKEETGKLRKLVEQSTKFVRKLPWAVEGINDGKGPFEASLFTAPDFTIVHALAFCSSIFWEAVNLPNYSDIRETCGSKNIVFANRMSANYDPNRPCHYVHPSELKGFRATNHVVRFLVTAIHELLGHGTGKLLTETGSGEYNFNRQDLPVNPITNEPISTWYLLGQTWTTVFGKLATSVEECRAMLVSYYLADDKEILDIFGYNDSTTLTAEELTYFTYLHVGVEGIQALQQYSVEDRQWTQPHARANFAILKHLLQDAGGALRVEYDAEAATVHVHVDRSKILSHGKPSLGRMLCKIHVWRSIADVDSLTAFYDPLSAVDGEYEKWWNVVVSNPEPRWRFVQPNTVLDNQGNVQVRLYEASNQGIIQSFSEREL